MIQSFYATIKVQIFKKFLTKNLDRFKSIFLAFSLWRTLPRILSAKTPKGSYGCINGLRFLAMAWIVLGHTYYLGPNSTQALGIKTLYFVMNLH